MRRNSKLQREIDSEEFRKSYREKLKAMHKVKTIPDYIGDALRALEERPEPLYRKDPPQHDPWTYSG